MTSFDTTTNAKFVEISIINYGHSNMLEGHSIQQQSKQREIDGADFCLSPFEGWFINLPKKDTSVKSINIARLWIGLTYTGQGQ